MTQKMRFVGARLPADQVQFLKSLREDSDAEAMRSVIRKAQGHEEVATAIRDANRRLAREIDGLRSEVKSLRAEQAEALRVGIFENMRLFLSYLRKHGHLRGKDQ